MAWNLTAPPLGPPRLPSGDAAVGTAAAVGEAWLPPSAAAITLPGGAEPFPVEGDEQHGRLHMEEVAGPRARPPGSTTLTGRPRTSGTVR